MVTEIQERIKVTAFFKDGRIIPKWFVWNNRKYEIKEITYTWEDRKGEARLLYFSVTDGANLFEVSFDHENFIWRLERVYVE